MDNLTLFPMGVVAEMLKVHPETIRVWERHGIIKPQRKSGKRFYSQADLKRLQFIKGLMANHLNLPAIRHYLQLYPCWQMEGCPSCMQVSRLALCAKPCWKEENAYCQISCNEETCLSCNL